MTVIYFLVDTTPKMFQRIQHQQVRFSYIEITKSAIQSFVSVRPNDRYALFSSTSPHEHIKLDLSSEEFLIKLDLLEIDCGEPRKAWLQEVFETIHLHRLCKGIDTFGHGYDPSCKASVVLILITPGGGLQRLKSLKSLGGELMKSPYRWDHRLFSLVLKIPGSVVEELDLEKNGSHLEYLRDDMGWEDVCVPTGGRSFSIMSYQLLFHIIEQLAVNLRDGVIVDFQMVSEESDQTTFANENQVNKIKCSMVLLSSSIYWPIPESFWPDITMLSLPPRDPHPVLKYYPKNVEPLPNQKFIPWDEYKLNSGSFTKNIIAKASSQACWQVFVTNSQKKLDQPIGYLKVNSKLTKVYLIILPFNYPVLVALVEELVKVLKYQPNFNWLKKFHFYVASIPMYYHTRLSVALSKIGLPKSLILDIMPKFVTSHLNRRLETYLTNLKTSAEIILTRKSENIYPPAHLIPNLLKNPFDIQRSDLLTQIVKMRCNFLQPTNRIRTASPRVISIAEMSNYVDYNREKRLREVGDASDRGEIEAMEVDEADVNDRRPRNKISKHQHLPKTLDDFFGVEKRKRLRLSNSAGSVCGML